MESPSARRRIYQLLEVAHNGDRLSRSVDLALIALVAANVVAVMLESVEPLYRARRGLFDAFEAISVSVFSIEYFLRVWSAAERASGDPRAWRERVRWVLSPMALADLAAILPFFLTSFTGLDLRFLRVLRLLRIFKLSRYSGSLTLLLEVFRSQRRAYIASLFVLMMVLVVAASGIYLVEREAQPVAFGSIPTSMWWALVTLTTVGYGDVTPITTWGKVFAGGVTLVGVGVVALPTAILASGFLTVAQRNHERLSHDAADAAADGYISPEESERYQALAERLGVPPEVAEEIMSTAAEAASAVGACPHCGKDPFEEV